MEEPSKTYKTKQSQEESLGNKVGILSTFHLIKIDKKGNVHFRQGLSGMKGIISKNSLELYYNKFDFPSREIIDKHFDVRYK